MKHSRIRQEWEGHEFHPCLKSSQIMRRLPTAGAISVTKVVFLSNLLVSCHAVGLRAESIRNRPHLRPQARAKLRG